MVAAVRVHKTGGPEVLTYEDVEVPAPGPGQIKIKNHACGVNFIDTYFRMGMYPSPVGMPFVSGNEGAGEVIAVGPGVTDMKVGDRVGYTFGARGLCGRAPAAGRPGGEASGEDQLRAGRRHDAQGHDGAVFAAANLQGAKGR